MWVHVAPGADTSVREIVLRVEGVDELYRVPQFVLEFRIFPRVRQGRPRAGWAGGYRRVMKQRCGSCHVEA